jgi:putative ABC transport system permease protein
MVRILELKLLRDVARRRAQFAAIVATVALGVGLFGASFDAYQNLLASYDELFTETHFASLTIQGGDRAEVAAAVGSVAGVDAVATRSTADLPVRVGETHLLGRLVGLPTDHRAAVNDVLLLSGSYLLPGDTDGVLVERHMADHFGLKAGDTVSFFGARGWETVVVRGVVSSAEYIWPARSRQEVLTLPDEFGVLFAPQALLDGLPPQATTQQVLVTYAPDAAASSLDAAVTQRAIAAGATDAFSRADQPSNAALQEDINGFGEFSFLFPVMFLTAAGLATYVLLSRMVLAQRPQIGLLLAVGYRPRRVFTHYLGFGVATGLLGAGLGAVLGLVLAGLITRVYTGVIAIPTTVIELRPTTVLFGIAFGAIAGALSGVAPAIRAARLSPAAAMSGQAAAGVGTESVLERHLAPLRRLPARWKMVLRGIGRSPVRSISTVVGVMIAVTLVLVSWGMIDTVQVLLDRQFNQASRADAVVYLPAGASEGALAALRGVSGVAAAEPLTQLSVTIDHGGQRYSTSLSAFPADTEMHTFLTSAGAQPLPGDGVLVGVALKDKIGLKAGDEVTLTFDQIGRSVRTTVAGFVDEPFGTFAYATTGVLQSLIGADSVTASTQAANVRLAGGADRSAAIAAIEGLPGVAAVIDARALQATANSLMGLFYAFVGAMLVLGGVMAFALLFNLMSANISERLTELASLRASGMSGAELSRIVTGENVLLTLAGIVPGLVVGYLGAAEFMASFSSDLFSFDLHVRPTTFLFTALGVLAAAFVSQLPVLRSVRRIDIARVVRERAT